MGDDVAKIAAGLTKAQRALVLASDPDDITGEEGTGVDIGGPQYRAARCLERLGIGAYTHGSPVADMYWNNGLGLAVRNHLQQNGSAAVTASKLDWFDLRSAICTAVPALNPPPQYWLESECSASYCRKCASPHDCTGSAKRRATPCEHCGAQDQQGVRDEFGAAVAVCDGCKAFVGIFHDDEGSRP